MTSQCRVEFKSRSQHIRLGSTIGCRTTDSLFITKAVRHDTTPRMQANIEPLATYRDEKEAAYVGPLP